jgi:hypothetical protein
MGRSLGRARRGEPHGLGLGADAGGERAGIEAQVTGGAVNRECLVFGQPQ